MTKHLYRTAAALLVFSLAAGSAAKAQWEKLPFRLNQVPRVFFVDTVDDALYIGGNFTKVNDTPCNLVRWDGSQYTRLTTPHSSTIFAITRFQGKLCVSGIYGTYQLNGGQWAMIHPQVSFSLPVIQGKLALLGMYKNGTDSTANPHIRLWDGTSSQFSDLYGFDSVYAVEGGFVYRLAEYKGQIYAAGNLMSSGSLEEIVRWDGTRWRDVGGGLPGSGLDAMWDVAVWNGHLYVSGWMSEATGGRGNGIVRWDGQHWQRLGDALQGVTYPISAAMCTWQGKLAVGGDFAYAGGCRSSRLALWDGTRWCSLGGTFDAMISNVASFRNTLYVGGAFKVVDSDSLIYLARWAGSSIPDTCSAPVTITTLSGPSVPANAFQAPRIYPNPFTHSLGIRWASVPKAAVSYTLHDALGRTVFHTTATATEIGLPLSGLPTGLYGLRITEPNGRVHTEKVVKE